MSINTYNGLITWSEPSVAGEYSVTLKVSQFDGNELVGYAKRDLQIIAESGSILRSTVTDNRTLDENNRIFVPEGNTYTVKIFAKGNAEIVLNLHAELGQESDVLSFETYDSLSGDMKVGLLTIKPDGEIVRDNPYAITIRTIFKLQSTYTFDVNYFLYTKNIELEKPIILETKDEEKKSTYPNPTTGLLKINYHSSTRICIRDVGGRVVFTPTVSQDGIVDLSILPTGLYVMEINTGYGPIKHERILKN